jgi:hypothetical protein
MIKILHIDNDTDDLEAFKENMEVDPEVEVTSLESLEEMEKEDLTKYNLVVLDGLRGRGWRKALDLNLEGRNVIVVSSRGPFYDWEQKVPFVPKHKMDKDPEQFREDILCLM